MPLTVEMENSGKCKSNILNQNGERKTERNSMRYSEMVSKRTTVIEKDSHTEGRETEAQRQTNVMDGTSRQTET